jgi:multisubunit Na+/H+ antiporter MnhG subunit
MIKKKECSMRKETLGAALFFCGLGIFLCFCGFMKSWAIRLIISAILMLLGLKIGGGC